MFKKYLSLILITSFICTNFKLLAYCALLSEKSQQTSVSKSVPKKNAASKEDTFIIPLIEDELAGSIDIKKHKKRFYNTSIIEDEIIIHNSKDEKYKKLFYKKTIMPDEEVIFNEYNKKYKPHVYKNSVNPEKGSAIVIKPVKKIKTANKNIKIKPYAEKGHKKVKCAFPELGERVEFKVTDNVVKDGEIIIPKGSIISAQISEVSPRAMGGAPAEMTLEYFEITDKNGKTIPLEGRIFSSGYSLAAFIGIAELATCWSIFGFIVSALRVLPGGQAVITPRKEYVVYY